MAPAAPIIKVTGTGQTLSRPEIGEVKVTISDTGRDFMHLHAIVHRTSETVQAAIEKAITPQEGKEVPRILFREPLSTRLYEYRSQDTGCDLQASETYALEFTDFEALNFFTASLAQVPFVSIHVYWGLTPETRERQLEAATTAAYNDALATARVLAAAMGKQSVVPLEVTNNGYEITPPEKLQFSHTDTFDRHSTVPAHIVCRVSCDVTFSAR